MFLSFGQVHWQQMLDKPKRKLLGVKKINEMEKYFVQHAIITIKEIKKWLQDYFNTVESN
jgi:hypothetical protein